MSDSYYRQDPYDERNLYNSEALYDVAPVGGMKRPRSPSPSYNRYAIAAGYEREEPYRSGESGSGWDMKRARSRDEYERDWARDVPAASVGAPYAAERSRRTWQDLDSAEKEREWQLYEREREQDRLYHGESQRPPLEGYRDEYGRPPHLARSDEYTPGNGYGPVVDVPMRAKPSAPAPRFLDPMDSPSILTFKRYSQMMRELGKEPAALPGHPSDALYNQYQEYRTAFHRRATEQVFAENKDAVWFREKYSSSEADAHARKARRKAGRHGRKAVWLKELRSGMLDKVCWDAEPIPSPASSSLLTTTRLGEREEIDESDSYLLHPGPNELLVRFIPASVSHAAIEEALQDEPGYRYVALGEPNPTKKYGRVGVVVLHETDSERRMELAARLSQKSIEGEQLPFEVTLRPAQTKVRAAPVFASTLARQVHDLRQALALVILLQKEDVEVLWEDDGADDEYLNAKAEEEIEKRAMDIVLATTTSTDEQDKLRVWLGELLTKSNATIAKVAAAAAADVQAGEDDAEEMVELLSASPPLHEQKRDLTRKMLDLHIDLLRQVYHCDYYSSTLSDYPEELLRRAPKSLRRATNASSTTKEAVLAEKDRFWAKDMDARHALLMQPDDNVIGTMGGTDVQAMLMEEAKAYSREDEAEKHRCLVKVNDVECGKPFKAQIFVQKHVLNKHREWFHSLMADKIAEARYFNNFIRDPQRPMPPLNPTLDRNSGAGAGREQAHNGGGGHGYAPPLGARLGGYDYHAGGYGNGASSAVQPTFYGAGNLVRMGGSAAARPVGRTGDLREHMDDGLLRMGDTTQAVGGHVPYRRPAPLDVEHAKPLDPRAAMARGPTSYQDLDGNVPSGGAELDLEY